MPRIPVSLLVKAHRENPLLPLLLKECRTLDSARNELRWLRERALRDSQSPTRWTEKSPSGWRIRLRSMCRQRSRGYPLQYILGDQPFGDLEILCRRGVLIPRFDDLPRCAIPRFPYLTRYIRQDTELYTYEAARLVRQCFSEDQQRPQGTPTQEGQALRILDLCTGTGCIALLLHALLAPHYKQIQVIGIDVSPNALELAQKNLQHNVQRGLLAHRASNEIEFYHADILGCNDSIISKVAEIMPKLARSETLCGSLNSGCDLLISNPPYISNSNMRDGTTARSVRLFEPRLALVPPNSSSSTGCENTEDIFYHRILSLSIKLRPRITVLECGDLMQARRVVELHDKLSSDVSEDTSARIWPSTEREFAKTGFHPHDGSRCVIIRRT